MGSERLENLSCGLRLTAEFQSQHSNSGLSPCSILSTPHLILGQISCAYISSVQSWAEENPLQLFEPVPCCCCSQSPFSPCHSWLLDRLQSLHLCTEGHSEPVSLQVPLAAKCNPFKEGPKLAWESIQQGPKLKFIHEPVKILLPYPSCCVELQSRVGRGLALQEYQRPPWPHPWQPS